MTDWNEEYHRDPSFAYQLASDLLYSDTAGDMEPIIKEALRDVLEPIVGQIQEYSISEDEIERMSAEIRSLYQ